MLKLEPKKYVGKDGLSQLLIYWRSGNDRVFFKNQIKVDRNHWLGEFVSSKHPNHSRINGMILSHVDSAQEILNSVIRKGGSLTKESIMDEMLMTNKSESLTSALMDYYREYSKTHPERSSDQILNFKKKIDSYVEVHGELKFSDITRQWVRDMAYELSNFAHYNQRNPLSNTGLRNWMSSLRTFMKWSYKEGYHKNRIYEDIMHIVKDYKKIPAVKPTMKMDEIAKLYRANVSRFGRDAEANRDAFVFMTQVGIRESDAERLKVDSIRDINNRMYLSIVTKKSKKLVLVPMNDIAMKIYSKYREGKEGNELLFPDMNKGTIGRHLKTICKHLGMNREIIKNCMRGHKLETVRVPFYTEVSSHIARYSFALHFMLRGGNIYSLQKMLGHASITTTEGYLRSLDDYIPSGANVELTQEELSIFFG